MSHVAVEVGSGPVLAKATALRRYWAFISYSQADNRAPDREWASWLQSEIESYEIPADLIGRTNGRGETIPPRITPVFRDEDELPAASDLNAQLYKALENSSVLIVLCSRRAATSKYVAEEIEYFKGLGRSDRIVPVLLSGEPGHAERECIPAPMSRLATPLAADFRLLNGDEGYVSPHGYHHQLTAAGVPRAEAARAVEEYRRRWQLAKLKVIAAILGLGLDDLRQRDRLFRLELERRKARVLRRWLSAVICLSVLAVVAGLYANGKRVEAERATADAEDFIEFLQDDAKMTLSKLGRLDLLDRLNKQVFRYLDNNPTRTTGLRHHVEAKAAYDEAMLLQRLTSGTDVEPLLRRAIDRATQAAAVDEREEWLDIAAVAAFQIANARLEQGHEAQALKSLSDAEDWATRALRADPNNLSAQTAKIGCGLLRARLEASRGNVDQSLASLAALDRWFEQDRVTAESPPQHDHVVVLLHMSEISLSASRSLDALQTAERALNLAQKVSEGMSRDSALSQAHALLGAVFETSSDLAKAAMHFESALEICRKALGVDSRSDEWSERATYIAMALARVRALDKDVVRAEQSFEEGVRYARERYRQNAGAARPAREFLEALTSYADFLSRTHQGRRSADSSRIELLRAEAATITDFLNATSQGDAHGSQ